MIKLIKHATISLLAVNIFVFSGAGFAREFRIDNFAFAMGAPIGTGTPGENVGIGPYGTLVEGTYQGTNSTNELVNFRFFTFPVYVYTTASNQGSVNTPAGTITGGPPPTFDLVNLTADLSSWMVQWNGTEFPQGSASAPIVDNLDNTYIIQWSSLIPGPSSPTNPFGDQTGYWRLDVTCTDGCPEVDLGPADSLTVMQAAQATRTVTTTDGPVVITSSFGVAPANYVFTWSSPTDNSITDTDGNEGTFTFDPSGLTPGIYIFNHTYINSTPFPNTRGNGSIAIRIVASATGDIGDLDNDGISNDNDDASLAASQLQGILANSSSFVLESDKGILKVGQTAFCAGKAARITLEDVENYGTALCTEATNTDDSIIKDTGVGGYYDFEVHGIALGDTAQIVIPLDAPIPPNALYRKYTPDNGWATFDSTTGDSLASAPGTADGVCPAPDSPAYTPGLTKGDNCARLTITDGGINDGDRSANGIVKDPGGVAEIESGVNANLSGCSIAGKPSPANEHGEWLIVAAFMTWIGFIARKRKKYRE